MQPAEGIYPVAAAARLGIRFACGKVAQRLDGRHRFRHSKARGKHQQCHANRAAKRTRRHADGIEHAQEDVVHEVDRHRQRHNRAQRSPDPCARRPVARLLAKQENARGQHDLKPGALILEVLIEFPRAYRKQPRSDRNHCKRHRRAEHEQPIGDLLFIAAEQVTEHKCGHVPAEDLELSENVQIDILRRAVRKHRQQDRMCRHCRRQHEQIHPPGLAERPDPAVENRREHVERDERIQIPEVHHRRPVERRDELRPDGAGRERVRQKQLPQHGYDRPARERHDQPRQPVAQQHGNVGRFPARHKQIARHHEKQRYRRKGK